MLLITHHILIAYPTFQISLGLIHSTPAVACDPMTAGLPCVHFLQGHLSYFDPLHPSWPETDQQLLLPAGQSSPLTSSFVSFVQWVDQYPPQPRPMSYGILEILVSVPRRSVCCEKQEAGSSVSLPLLMLA